MKEAGFLTAETPSTLSAESSFLCITIVEKLRRSRKFSADLNSNTGIYSRQGAKYAKFGGKS
jgi:hypothetical protein